MVTAGRWVKAARVCDVQAGQVRAIDVAGRRLALCRVGEEFYAVDNVCTHDDGPLADGTLEDHQIECPRHGARFDVRTGGVKCLPAVLPIQSYPVKIEGPDVWVQMP